MATKRNEMSVAKDLAMNGHNFIITGQCGTGKTFLLKNLIKELANKKVGITATTGMASNELGKGATTLHHWCGILDGRYTIEFFMELFKNDDRFVAAKQRIEEADCLIIDEISMLSMKTFELIECLCRLLRDKTRPFGGLQVIGCGDFKQLPPVPNYRLQDDGKYCLESSMFKDVFPHHINLTKVVRQNEPDLIKAVHELGDGSPSEETMQLLRSLDRPLPVNDCTTFLHGTNFDVNFLNQETLESLEGQMYQFKAQDEGPLNILSQTSAPKTLLLKEGAPIIFIRNIEKGIFNGTRGVVQNLSNGNSPVVNVRGNLVTLTQYQFDVFDSYQEKVLATRKQYPIVLAYSMTVHRSQSQTLPFVDVDCASFFAPGQLGVAVGRVQSKEGLRVRNVNVKAANMKHPSCVYNFYDSFKSQPIKEDKSCCHHTRILTTKQQDSPKASTSTDDHQEDFVLHDITELPRLECPWNINNFLLDNAQSSFLSLNVDKDFFQSSEFTNHFNYVYYKVNQITMTPFTSTKSIKVKTSEWNSAFGQLNNFLTSDDHLNACCQLFKVKTLSKFQNKLSTKVVMWLMDQEISQKAKEIVVNQENEVQNLQPRGHSSAGKAKIRYIAGACVAKISTRLKNSVLRKIGSTSTKSRITRKFHYKQQCLLRQFRISEEEAPSNESMNEINAKQGPSRGLTIISDCVFSFFTDLNSAIQMQLTVHHFHLHAEELFNVCRNSMDNNVTLITQWINLFPNDTSSDDDMDDEIFLSLIMDLFKDVTEHFLRIAFVDALKSFKATVPRKKKQALRNKVKALGERDSKTNKLDNVVSSSKDDSVTYICNTCKQECDWEPSDPSMQSIACDRCNNWFHYKCSGLTGDESFLQKKASKWFCFSCGTKGKGKGKGKGRGKQRQT